MANRLKSHVVKTAFLLLRAKSAVIKQNCAHFEISMKLGTVVDLDLNVNNPMRTHLNTAPKVLTVMTSSYGRKEFFDSKYIRLKLF